MDFQWIVNGLLMDFQWIVNGFLMEFQWICLLLPTSSLSSPFLLLSHPRALPTTRPPSLLSSATSAQSAVQGANSGQCASRRPARLSARAGTHGAGCGRHAEAGAHGLRKVDRSPDAEKRDEKLPGVRGFES